MAFVAFTPEQFRALDELLASLNERLKAVETASIDGLEDYVNDWLDAHPEATTRIEDGSITAQKLNVTVTYTVDSNGNLTITLE